MSSKIVWIAQIHNCYLSFNFFESAIIFEFDDSTGIVTSIYWLFVVGEEYFAHCSFSQLFLKLEFCIW